MIIHRKDSCFGITLFRFFRWKLELWYSPANYSCEEHVHKNFDGEFFVFYGKHRSIWRKRLVMANILGQYEYRTDMYDISKRKYFKWFTVKANSIHGFSTGATSMIWLCWETYKKGIKVTSPAVDFHPTVKTT